MLVFWIIMLVDSIKRKFKNDTEKIVWVLVIIFTGLLGGLIYYFAVFWNDKNKSMKWFWWTLLILAVLIILAVVFWMMRSIGIGGFYLLVYKYQGCFFE